MGVGQRVVQACKSHLSEAGAACRCVSGTCLCSQTPLCMWEGMLLPEADLHVGPSRETDPLCATTYKLSRAALVAYLWM
jgi:hypothetical protein